MSGNFKPVQAAGAATPAPTPTPTPTPTPSVSPNSNSQVPTPSSAESARKRVYTDSKIPYLNHLATGLVSLVIVLFLTYLMSKR